MVRRVQPRQREGVDLQWLRGMPRLVAWFSRVVGTAPLVLDRNRVRISRALLLYGVFVIAVTSGILILCSVLKTRLQKSIFTIHNTDSTTTRMLTNLYVSMKLMINVCAVVFTSDRMKTWIEVLERVQKMKSKLGAHGVRDNTGTRDSVACALAILFYLLGSCLDLFSVEENFCPLPSLLCYVAGLSHVFTYLVILTIELQFMYISQHVTSVFPSFNKLLLQLLPTDDDAEITDISTTKAPASQYFIFRELNECYTELCELADVMNHRHIGLTMFMVIVSSALQLLIYPYIIVIMILSQPIPMKYIVTDIIWVTHRVIMAYLNIAPGHQIIQHVQQTQDTLNKVMGKVLLCTDDVAVQLKKLAMKMMLVQPTFAPLAVCTLSRSLLVTIIWAAATYVVIVVQFHSSEMMSHFHFNNITNTTK